MIHFFQHLFDTTGFPARWHCGTWSDALGWLHILSDIAIFGAYAAIPLSLLYFTYRRKDIPFTPIVWLFAAFIVSCGLVHAIDATIFWHPWYRLSGAAKLFTALMSWATVIALVKVMPAALSLPGMAKVNRQLQEEIARRQQSEAAVRASEEQHRAIFSNAAVGIAHVDLDGRWQRVNDALCAITGYSRQEILEKTFDDITPPEDIQRGLAPAPRPLSEQSSSYISEKRYLRKDGSVRWVELTLTVVRDPQGKPLNIIAVIADISERKQAEEAVRTLTQELESRVVQRTKELMTAVQSLEEEIAARQRLEREILEISEREQCRLGQDLHDGLGQELAGIALLGKVLAGNLMGEGHTCARMATQIATFTNATIESARRLAKGLYPVELTRHGLMAALEDLAEQTSVRFGIACELRSCGNKLKLEPSTEIHIYRIVQECIGNAIKHGQANRITIEYAIAKGSHNLTVTDNGVGFERKPGSSGMGLHLMEYRARVIGAQVSMAKGESGGCRVSCRLPVRARTVEAPLAPEIGQSPQA